MTSSMEKNISYDYDYIIIGSGFGGAVSALRLTEKGYRVAIIEQGKWYKQHDFAKTNWHLRRWFWLPSLRLFGIMRLTFFRHITVLSGVGVGGGSLVYACTLPVPKAPFFNTGSWAKLNNWQETLTPFYQTALTMLGATANPQLEAADHVLQQIAHDVGKLAEFHATNVGIYFGDAGKTVTDPFFKGQGPERTGCIRCGGCMTGCRHNAKNSLDKNYLHLAQQQGASILAETKVTGVAPQTHDNGNEGYIVSTQSTTQLFAGKKQFSARGVIFSAGVLGTIPLLLKLKKTTLPLLSDMVGKNIRTNNENLIAITSLEKTTDFSKGIAIGSIFHPDSHSHVEPCRYSDGSGFWRLLLWPRLTKRSASGLGRVINFLSFFIKHPLQAFKLVTVDNWAKRTPILLFMQHLDSTLQFTRNVFGGMKTNVEAGGSAPSAFIPAATAIAAAYAKQVGGVQTALFNESLLEIPGTAHILGGAVMGASRETGVIDAQNRVFGYKNMLVCDGSMISANPGVNPSLSITAITEHAMSLIQPNQLRL